MNIFKIAIFGLCAFMFMTGCETMDTASKFTRPVIKKRVFDASYDVVWNAVLETVSSQGVEITAADKNKGVITFKKALTNKEAKEYIAPDSRIAWYRANANGEVLIKEEDVGKITVVINMSFRGSISGSSGPLAQSHGGDTSGVFEEKVFYGIKNLVSGN
ncbi:MAG: hypothetical protein PHU64_00430 [Candidatus Omnitrophica bacterium]|nr:hypothetical protein [Candidatus Omnitrophota bacterium]MDD5429671.1 hypothetical protein [Candidatus Omnitrophota bacterium]